MIWHCTGISLYKLEIIRYVGGHQIIHGAYIHIHTCTYSIYVQVCFVVFEMRVPYCLILHLQYAAGQRMSRRDRDMLDHLEDQELTMSRREHHLEVAERSWLRKCSVLLRPFQITIGIVCFLMALLIFLSLLLTK